MKKNPLLIAGFALLALTSIVALVYVMRFANKPKVNSVAPTVLTEGKDSIIEVRGKNFPDTSSIRVDLGGIPARLIAKSNSKLTVVVDLSKLNKIETGEEFSEDLVVRLNTITIIKMQPITIKPDNTIEVSDIDPTNFNVGNQLTLKGKNLQRTGQIEIYFGKNAPNYYAISQMQKAAIIPVSRKQLIVKVPEIPGVEPGKADDVNIVVMANGNKLYSKLGTLKKPWVFPNPNVSTIFNREAHHH